MNDISPLALMYAMFVGCLLLVVAGAAVWGFGQLKRLRLAQAIKQLGEIFMLTDEALRTHSREKQNAVNAQIEQWDKTYSREIGMIIPQLSWSEGL